MASNKVTVCLTSCNRFDLLKRTLDSFFNLNTYPIEKFIITEDSVQNHMKESILRDYGDKVELVFNPVNLGPFKSIDNMYETVNTDYIFHMEDDWEFKNNPNFISQSIDILEENSDIHQIWIRDDAHPSWIEQQRHKTSTGVEFRKLIVPHCGAWCGFSLNPGLRRLKDYKEMFPNGYAAHTVANEKLVITELMCNNHALSLGYRGVVMTNSACSHIGGGRTTLG